jgi:eukaryotic-like serine/threonine-protein kinase
MDRWREIEKLYHQASERAESERSLFLQNACLGDTELQHEVELLLAQEIDDSSFLGPSAMDNMAMELAQEGRSIDQGERLGAYEILSLLGRGGMGEVYLARDIKLGREVALKVLANTVASDPAYLRRFEDEARLASGLNHPNIVTIYGAEAEGDVAYIAMELVRGHTLRKLLAQGLIPVKKTLDLAVQIADALAAAHAGGVVHRDLKPENIMVTAEERVKVLDFGLARGQADITSDDNEDGVVQASLPGTGIILGTVGYMSPEQVAGRIVCHTADQFAFGAILFEMLSGRRAFQRETKAETLSAIVHERPISIQSVNADVTPPLQQIVDRCLAKDAADRYPVTRDLAAQLRQIRDRWDSGGESRAISIGATVSASEPGLKLTRRQAMWLGGAAVVGTVAGFTTWKRWRGESGIRSVAVLPFTNAAKDEEAEYLCDGITDGLIQRIALLPSLKVMARSTVFNLKAKTVDPRTAGRLLGVDAIVTGTVTRRSGRLLISAELVDVATGVQLWSGAYDRSGADVLIAQDEITTAIVDEGIRLQLTRDERQTIVRHPTEDAVAYELYLRAEHHHVRETESDYLSARSLLEQAIARDPRFAVAHMALAGNYAVMAVDGYARPTEAWPLVDRYARQAIALDSALLEAHAWLAAEAFWFNWNWAVAEWEWEIALRSPSGTRAPDFLLGYTLERWALGRPEDALRLTRKGRELDPLSLVFRVREADLLLQTGQVEAAADLYEKVIHDEPADGRAYFGLAEVRRMQARFDDALDLLRQGYEANAGGNPLDDSFTELLSMARGADGYRQVETMTAQLELDALMRRAAETYASPLDFARAYARLGNKEQAVAYLNASLKDRAPGLVFLKADRAWDAVRDDPRFVAAVQRVGLP